MMILYVLQEIRQVSDDAIISESFDRLYSIAEDKMLEFLNSRYHYDASILAHVGQLFEDVRRDYRCQTRVEDHFLMIEHISDRIDLTIEIIGELNHYRLYMHYQYDIGGIQDSYTFHISEGKMLE